MHTGCLFIHWKAYYLRKHWNEPAFCSRRTALSITQEEHRMYNECSWQWLYCGVSHIFCPWKHEKVLAATCNETLVFLIPLNILVCIMCSYHSANMRWRKMQHPKCGLKINEHFRKMLHVYVHITANMKINSNLTHSRDTLLGKTAF